MMSTDHLRPAHRSRTGAALAKRALANFPRATTSRLALFARLVVPLDLTGDSRAALNTALLIAQSTHAQITLLHVVPEIEAAPRHEHAGFYRALGTAAEKKLAVIAKRFRKKHLKVREEIRVGDPLAEILGCAKKAKADLIILRSHRFAPNKPGHGWATVSYKLASLCQCPVLLAK